MGALAGARVACHLGGLLLFGGCFPAGAQLGALVAVAALPLLGEGPGGARRQGWARWAAVVAFSLLGTTALAGWPIGSHCFCVRGQSRPGSNRRRWT